MNDVAHAFLAAPNTENTAPLMTNEWLPIELKTVIQTQVIGGFPGTFVFNV